MSKLKKIKCQFCTKKQRDNKVDYKGCPFCGGYGIIKEVGKCGICNKEFFISPDPFTCYEGKKLCSFDGLPLRISISSGLVCEKCYNG